MAKGMYTTAELADSLIVDLNALPRHLAEGQFIAFCDGVSKMAQKLAILSKSIKNDLKSKDEYIEQLKAQLREAGTEIKDMTTEEFVDKYGESNKAVDSET